VLACLGLVLLAAVAVATTSWAENPADRRFGYASDLDGRFRALKLRTYSWF